MSNSKRISLETEKILGVKVTSSAEKEILSYIITGLKEKGKKLFVTTPNPEIIVFANRNGSFQNVLNSADIALPDGVGVLVAAKILGKKVQSRITGVDFVHLMCEEVSSHNMKGPKRLMRVGFVGGRGDVAERTADCLKKKYPSLEVLFVGEEWETRKRYKTKVGLKNTNKNIETEPDLDREYVDILFVAFGFPKQEQWINKNLPNKKIGAAIGVGGAFDYISGDVRRAPKSIRKIGLEWLYRLIWQPWRWRRQVALIEFGWLTLRQRFTV